MKKKVTELIVCLLSVICFLTACHTPQSEKLADGTYQADVTLTGGSGRATVDSPAAITVKDGKIYATIVWSVKRDGLFGTDEDGAVGSLLCHAVSCGTIRGV